MLVVEKEACIKWLVDSVRPYAKNFFALPVANSDRNKIHTFRPETLERALRLFLSYIIKNNSPELFLNFQNIMANDYS